MSSIGNAKSLRGGTLLMTPLKGADGQIYAIAQGNLVVGGAGASAGGSKVQINHLSAGRIPGGATVERGVDGAGRRRGHASRSNSTRSDFGTAQRVVEAINRQFGAGTADALDGRVIRVRAPEPQPSASASSPRLENLDVTPDAGGGARW